ncbi:MAG: T9SS type A sorting domain-containing protein [Bacteroidetes bacterium]|nr:T9SS type A sorting domain-containing protein [Bacteroidota bacterium]
MKKHVYLLITALFMVFANLFVPGKGFATAIDSISGEITPILCNGDGTGAIILTIHGGTSPYTYLWNNGSSQKDRHFLHAGTYSVTVHDADGDQASRTFTLEEPELLWYDAIVTPVGCYGANDGDIDLIVFGGTPPFNFNWSNGSTEEDQHNLTTGIYHVVVTDFNGCSSEGDILISGPAFSFGLNVVMDPLTCFENNTGSIAITPAGGVPPFSYAWNDGATTQTRSDLAAGTYYVTVIDNNGNCSSAPVTVTQPTPLSINEIITQPNCSGVPNGSIVLTIEGGTQDYTYLWSNGAVTKDISDLGPGFYSVTVTDANGCTANAGAFQIFYPEALSISWDQVDVTCNGGYDGIITLTITGGMPPYTYLWDDGYTELNRYGIVAGSYILTVTDDIGCSTFQFFLIQQPEPILLQPVVTNIPCWGLSNGHITLNPVGGTGPYTYAWSNGATTKNLLNVPAGSYSVVVTDSQGCTIEDDWTLTQPDYLWFGVNVTGTTCPGGSNGSLHLIPFGGTGPYTYLWNDGATGPERFNLQAGVYRCTVTDFEGCTYSAPLTVGSPAPFSYAPSITNVSCFGGNNGAINITPSGGTAPYTFIWSNLETTEDLSGLTQGTYGLTITDAHNCVAQTQFDVTEPDLLAIDAAVNQVKCPGGNDGSITSTISGGTPPFVFSWNDGTDTLQRDNLTAGTYFLTVTDSLGCSLEVDFTVFQPDPFAFNENVTNISCNGRTDGSISLAVSGGTGPYTYLWSTGQTDEMIDTLGIGDYTVTITDDHLCAAETTFTITQPEVLAATLNPTNISCFGLTDGQIDLIVTGGTTPFSYLWSNLEITEDLTGLGVGNYSVVVTDFNGCIIDGQADITEPTQLEVSGVKTDLFCFGDLLGTITLTVDGATPPYSFRWSDGNEDQDRTGLGAGTYSVTVTDYNNCQNIQSFDILQPEEITVLETISDVTCNADGNGSIGIITSGGITPYNYLWSTGAITSDITGLSGGTYTLSITDGNNCEKAFSFDVYEPDLLVVDGTLTNITCFNAGDGTITLNVTGGNPDYSYLWSNDETTSSLTGLTPGDYTVTVTDTKGCTSQSTFSITQPAVLDFSAVISPVTCYAGSNGSIDITAFGGTPVYTYLWSTGSTSEDLTGLTTGVYHITVSDANGCTKTNPLTVSEPTEIIALTATQVPVNCNGGTDGGINLEISGGTPDYSFLWSNGSTDQNLTGVAIGSYTVTATDADLYCSVISATVLQPEIITSSSVVVDASCNGLADGTITLTVQGGNAPYSYNWDNGAISDIVTGLAAGTYAVHVTDAKNCQYDTTIIVGEPQPLIFDYQVLNVSCYDAGDGQIIISTSGGTPDYSWAWSNLETTESIASLTPGDYHLAITDAHFCTTTGDFTISQPGLLEIVTDEVVPVLCHNGNNGAINLSVTGGSPDYSFLWNDGATTEDRTGLTAGTYTVTVTDAHFCAAEESFIITETFTIIIDQAINPVSCNGRSDGSIELSVSGGTEPYTYLWENGDQGRKRYDLPAGDYTVIVTDANGCSETAVITVQQPDNLIINGSVTNVSCFGLHDGSIMTETTGGNGEYSWLWSNEQITEDLENIPTGTYSVTVTDKKGCTASNSFDITSPMPVTGLIQPYDQTLVCSGNTIIPIIFVPDHYLQESVSYSWTRDHVLDVTGIPASGTDSVTGNLINTTFNSIMVTFTINATIDGCPIVTQTSTVHVAPAFQVGFTNEDIMCHGDSVLVNVHAIGGIGPFTGEQSLYLGAGSHTFTITDGFGCVATGTLGLTEPPLIEISGVPIRAICTNQPNGGINVNVSGGSSPYTYLWNDGVTTEDRTELLSGIYTLTVTDSLDCQMSETFVVGAWHPAPQGSLDASPVGCYGQPNQIYFYLSGSAPWSITYSIGTTTYAAANINTSVYTINPVLIGPTTIALLSVIDKYCIGSVLSNPITINVVTPPAASLVIPSPICKGQESHITVNLTGTAPWTLTWFDGVTPHTVTGITSSPYIITSTPTQSRQYSLQYMADNYCTASTLGTPVTQIVYMLPTATLSGNPTICEGLTTSLQVHFTGLGPWQIEYTDGVTTHTISNIGNVNYNLLLSPSATTIYQLLAVRDQHCDGNVFGTGMIQVNPRPTTTWIGPDSACLGSSITLSLVLTGSPPWSLIYYDGTSHSIPSIMYSPYTIYSTINANKTFTVTYLVDANCQALNQQQMGQPKLVKAHSLPTGILSGPSNSCYGVGADIQVDLTGTPPWTVAWYENAQLYSQDNIMSSPFVFHVDPSNTTNYFLSSIHDVFCPGIILGQQLTVSVSPSPVLELGNLQANNAVCSGLGLNLIAAFLDGVPPFTLNYLDETGNLHSLTDLVSGSEIQIIPPAIPGSYNYEMVSVSGNNGCEVILNQLFTIVVIAAPTIDAGPDSTITLGSSLVLNGVINGGVAPFTIQWIPADYLDDPTSLTPTCTPLVAITYTLQVTDSIGCLISDQVNIGVDMSRNIFGYVNYDNQALTPMNNCKIMVKNSLGTVIDSTLTGSDGYYSFTNLPDGNFTLRGSTDKPFGGVNSTDALLILKNFVGMQHLEEINILACDVEIPWGPAINAIDALAVAKRFTGQISSFSVGDWYFEHPAISIPTAIAQYDIRVLCSGDANSSYIPAAKVNSTVTLTTLGEVNPGPGNEVIIPVYIENPLEIGAVSLVLNIPANLTEISSVTLADGTPVIFSHQTGVLRISWYNTDPLKLSAMGEFIRITAKVSSNVIDDQYTFTLGTGCELADALAAPLENVNLLIPKVIANSSSLLDLGVNYPNPFSNLTRIAYSIPEDGFVKISVFDPFGKEVATVVNEIQSAGIHEVTVDGSGLSSGVYLYKLSFRSSNGESMRLRKMSILR